MNIALSDTILYVTGKQGLENTTQEALQTMVAEYPYFAPAQLVYAAKLKNDNSFKLQTQVQKTGLFFNNFKWLQYQLLEAANGGFSSNIPTKTAEVFQPVEILQQIEETAKPLIIETVITEVDTNTPKQSIEIESIPHIENYDVAETITTNAYQFMPNLSIPTVEDVKDIMNGIDDKKDIEIDVVTEEIIDTKNNEINLTQDTIEEEYSEFVVATNTLETNNISSENEAIETVTNFENDIHAEIAAMKANWYARNNEEDTLKTEEPVTNIEAIKNGWDKPLEVDETTAIPIDIEPYYTIDYFAAQGIKFDYTKEPQDKLTVKMLKFTDWLKKMKSPKQEARPVEEDPELDTTIQNIADASNQSKEIVTETMAEIFAKQGKTDKAIQLYIKLSFLIPNKSAYFATKLNELKGI